MERRVRSVALLWLISVIVNSCSGQPSFSLSASPSSVAVSSDSGEVFVAAGAQLLRLDDQLRLLENVTVSGELLRIALSPGGGRLVGCLGGSSRTCLVFNSSSLWSGAIATVSGAEYLTENGLAVIAVDHSFYLGSEGAVSAGNEIQLSQYNYTAEGVRTREYNVDVTGGFVRLFYGGFARNGYVYYFVADQQTGNGIRVLRVCDCESGNCSSSSFEALYELTLQCRGSTSSTTEVCGVTLLETFVDRDEPMVVVTQCEDGSRNRVCGYLLSDIDSRMDTSYEQCRDTTVTQIRLPWESVTRQCSSFTPLDFCDFDRDFPAIIPGSELSGYYLVNLGETAITAGVAVRIEGVSLVYVAYNGAIEVFNITETDFFTQQELGDAVATHPVSSPVRDLQWSEGADYIIVTTDEMVFQLPLEMCSQYSSCSECVGMNRYPLCGWCTVENKCSRRSQCQDSSEERRWVVNDDECISSTVTPQQFVLERPTIVNVTASPSLPSGLTYNCSFSGSGDVFPIEVEAVEVVAGTEYQCDIRGAITDLGTVKAASAFSFVSVEIGIPFATSEDALTIYDCDAASSCGGCVQTANACGWCLYGNVCSGTPDPCPVPAGVNNSYLQLGDRSSYVEVCPILDPAPTSSGDYTQPVRVERSLQLQTRNLPEPVDGFDYVCMLGGDTLPAPYNATDGSVECTVGENEVTTASTVSLELIWGNGTIQYSIDESSVDDIRCILYDCPLLASGCSSCLALNTMGFQCGWCSADASCDVVEECSDGDIATSTSQCPNPAITSVLPPRGPVEGGTHLTITGTNLGAAFSDIVEVTLQGASNVTCNVAEYESDYIPGTQVVCETEAFSSVGDYVVVVVVNRSGGPVLGSGQSFSVEQPTVSGVSPVFGPVSGGVEVRISGSDLDTGNTEDTRVELNGVDCVVKEIMSDDVRCTSGAFASVSSPNTSRTGLVIVLIDNANISMSGVEFEYRDDPVYSSVSPQRIIPAGGIAVMFEGMNLDVVDQPVIVFTDPRLTSSDQGGNCSVSSTTMTCVVPSFMSDTQLPANISYTIRVGDAPGPDLTNDALTLSAVPDPIFAEDGSAIVGDSEHTIGSGALLMLTGLSLDSVERNEISVTVGGEPCSERQAAEDDTNTEYVCTPPDDAPGGNREALVVVRVGANLEFAVGTLTYTESDSGSSTPLYVIIIAASAAGGVVLFSLLVICCIICWYTRKTREKEKRFTNLLAQMELWEVEMADECKRAFTELQTDLADLVQISDDKNLPYRDFRSFAMRFLFPSAGEDHPVLNPLAVANKEEIMPHLQSFRELIMDRKFLLLFVRTLEAQQGRFSLQDKCNVASLLMVALQNDLDYATEILKTLLSEVMHHAVTKSHPKLLLRRTESVAEKMLANWLCFLLFPYLLEHAGEPLFILYRAIKSQLEKGPVDVITGEARHSLSEEKLLRQKFDVKPVEGVVETDTEESVPIKLLDCDTVTQAKEKILDVLHKNTAVSKRPQLHEADLELRRATAGVTLRDHDQTNEKDGEWTKINTLGHYRLAEMSQAAIDNPKNPTPRFKLVPRPERPISGVSFDHFGTIIANLNSPLLPTQDMPRVFHLVKPDHEVEDGTGPRQGKILSEVFLTRLLSTKRILQPYVDDLFKAIFAVPRGKPLPKAIKWLFDFLDLQAAELGIQDPEILHTWKTNSLPLRFWVSLIKNPDFVFDIHKSATVDACLTIIAQAYIDACSTSDIKYTKDTPSARLLYVNEVKGYKQDVQQYYGTVQSLPKLSDYEMSEFLRETAQVCAQSVDPSNELDSNDIVMTRQLYFVTESALYELFKFVTAYSVELKDALNDEGLTHMASKLEQLQRSIKV